MEKLTLCRICLVENIRMFIVANKNLQELYEKLTDIPFVTEDCRPMLACFLCYAKLKQCYQLLTKCLEAEEVFAQMLNEDYEQKPLISRGQLNFSRLMKTPIENISIVDVSQIECKVIKEEQPADPEIQDDIDLNEKHRSDELELESLDNSHPDQEDIPPNHSESVSEDDIFIMKFKTEVDEEDKVFKKKPRVKRTKNQEDISPNHSESVSEDDIPLMNFVTKVNEEEGVFKKKRRVKKMKRTPVAQKPERDTRRAKQEDTITTEQKKNVLSDSKIIYTTNKPTSESVTESKETTISNIVTKSTVNGRIINKEKELHKCCICQRGFRKKSDLTRHIISVHSSEKPYKCDVCQRRLKTSFALKQHIRKHTGENPYKCDLCSRTFAQMSSLQYHISTHTGEKPYICDMCPFSFARISSLKYHIRTHTGEKPYKCDMCSRAFARTSSLQYHIRTHTGEKPYKCDMCPLSFARIGYLKYHIRTHTGKNLTNVT